MLGNDVVDLEDPESRAEGLHPRFDHRVFTSEERAGLAGSLAPDRDRWVLWAAKEAAFKALRRLDPRVPFSPRRFETRLPVQAGTCWGSVRHGSRRLWVRAEVGPCLVHAVSGVAGEHGVPLAAVGPVPDGPNDPRRASHEARRLARVGLARALELPTDALDFDRVARLPRLRVAGRATALPLSFSHHGRFAAFAALLP
ncbi:MAG: 4'-phosphopantetheinyl transferase superfamily protein [Myxococcota bacterium]